MRHAHASRGLMLAEKSCPAARSMPCAMFWPCCKPQPDAHPSHARVMPCAAPVSGSLVMRMHKHSAAGREGEGGTEGGRELSRETEGGREGDMGSKKKAAHLRAACHAPRERGYSEGEGGAPRETEGGREGGAARERLVDDRVASPIGKPPIELHTQGPVRALSTVACVSTHTDVQSSQDLHYV